MKKAIYSPNENGRITNICEPGQEFPISEPLEWIDVADDTTEQDTWNGTKVVKFVPHVPDYAELRRGAYADVGDQLDMLWHAIDSGDWTAAKVKTTDFYTELKAVKDDNPKPEGD